MLQILITISHAFSLQWRDMGYAKVIQEKKVSKKWTSVRINKTMGTPMPA
jgi:hypothetical protein